MRKPEPRVVVIGAGMAGILSAIRLAEAGVNDVQLYEKGDRVGGTWRENTYPGIGCDVPSHIYSYSFALNPDWSHLYSPGDEIRRYFQRVADEHGVTEATRFGEEVVRCEFVDHRWRLTTSTGRRDEADFVIAATGVLHHPKSPEIDGLDGFAGACFHSARWDHGVAIDGKRVGVVGTGSSAVQIVGAITARTEKLCLFQRTAQWIAPQVNTEYGEAEREAFRSDPQALRAMRTGMADAFHQTFSKGVLDASSEQMENLQRTCLENLESSVRDPGLRERLRPDYQAGCKRLVISADFYEAIQRPNAELVTEEILRVVPEGVVTVDGQLHELDVLVLATGFRVDRFVRPTEVIGREGVKLDELWRERPIAYLSISVPGIPNFFMLNGPNGPVGNFSLIEIAERQLDYILQLIELHRAGEAVEISASAEATQRYEDSRCEAARDTVSATGCRSWYLDDRGVPATWPWTFERFRSEMSQPRLEHYELVGD